MIYAKAINATSGFDTQFGGTGDDLLTGGTGSDVFVIAEGLDNPPLTSGVIKAAAVTVQAGEITDSSGDVSNIADVSATTLDSIENIFHQDLSGNGVIDTPAAVIEATSNIPLISSQMTEAATIGAGATLELAGACSGSITFAGATGTLDS